MLKATIPVSLLNVNAGYIPAKIKFSYAKTKQNLSKLFQEHQERYQQEKDKKGSKLMNIPQSFINTAFSICQVFISEFHKGKVKNGVMRVTKSFIQGSMVGSKLSIRTIDRHLERLISNLALPFIKLKFRSTLGLETGEANLNTNCIAIVLDPSVIACENEHHQKMLTGTLENKPVEVQNKLFGGVCPPTDFPPLGVVKTLKQQEDELMVRQPKRGMTLSFSESMRSGGFLQDFGSEID